MNNYNVIKKLGKDISQMIDRRRSMSGRLAAEECMKGNSPQVIDEYLKDIDSCNMFDKLIDDYLLSEYNKYQLEERTKDNVPVTNVVVTPTPSK